MRELLKTKIDVDHVNGLGWTALLEAVILGDGSKRYQQIVDLLVKGGANVNLADKDVDRFAQVGVTLQVEDPKFADQIKAYMPAIRSNVLMVLSHKTAAELLSREGKEKLAKDIMRESVRPMGIELEDEEEDTGDTTKKKKKKKKAAVESPVTQVLFSNFIVQ